MYCFAFIFAYRGKLYDSYDRSVYTGYVTDAMRSDANLSTITPDEVYVINGRQFHFSGGPYYR